MGNDDYKIMVTKVAQGSAADHFGKIEPTIIVSYTVGSHGPFTEVYPKATYDPAQMKRDLQAAADKIRQATS